MALSAIKNYRTAYKMERSDTNESNTDEDEEEFKVRRQCKQLCFRNIPMLKILLNILDVHNVSINMVGCILE